MLYPSVRLYRPVRKLIIPVSGVKGKNICLCHFPENDTFFGAYANMGIRPNYVRHYLLPTIARPVRSYMTPEIRRQAIEHKLRPIKAMAGDYSKVLNKNFYLDFSAYINKITSMYKPKSYLAGRPVMLFNNLLNTLSGVPKDSFERVLLYTVNLNEPVSTRWNKRRFFLVYNMLMKYQQGKIQELPFDKIMMFLYDDTSAVYYLMYDAEKKNTIPRIRAMMLRLKSQFEDQDEDQDAQDSVESIATTISQIAGDNVEEQQENKKKIFNVLKNAVKDDTEFKDHVIANRLTPEEIITKSISKSVAGDDQFKQHRIENRLNKMPTQAKRNYIMSVSKNLTPKTLTAIENKQSDPIGRNVNYSELVDFQNPKHLLDKRKNDFKTGFKRDLTDVFKTLETKDYPMKLTDMQVKVKESASNEIDKSILEEYKIELEDQDGRKHKLVIEIPHLTENGTFVINGQQKVILNQIITFPIFFPKPYEGAFRSNYSTMSLYSKEIRKGNFISGYMGGYKFHVINYMCYALGFDETMRMFGIKWKIVPRKQPDAFILPDKTYMLLDATTELGKQIALSIERGSKYLPKTNLDVLNKLAWRQAIENELENRNCTYVLDQTWQNIVTPIEYNVLKQRGYPTDIANIIKYMCSELINGRVDDRNDLSKLRIRTSEILTALLHKQINSAYNEFMAKKLGGDDNATMYVNTRKVHTDIMMSQNIQSLENINPSEELSMMTRVSPVGIGGVGNKEEVPQKALNLHPSYYGNIDPLETPDGSGVGVQQHLTVGASISDSYGTFNIKNKADIKANEILSATASMIPFVESNDGCRVTMATANIKQALPLKNLEQPAVQSGYETILTPLLSDNFLRKSPIDGVVTEITTNVMRIKGANGRIHALDITPNVVRSGQGIYGLGVFNPTVSVGQKVKEGSIVAEGCNVKDGTISNGRNFLVAYMPWKGYNFEDGMVISKSAAEKLTSVHVLIDDQVIPKDEFCTHMVKIGDTVKKGDPLMSYGLIEGDTESYHHVRSKGNGKVVNIEIFLNVPEENVSEYMSEQYASFKERYISQYGSYPVGKFFKHGAPFEGTFVKITVQNELYLELGDKIANRHYNKGVVARIENDEDMPLTPWGERVEIVYNPLSMINRMNTGQLMEAYVGLISKKLGDLCISKPRKDFIEMLSKVFSFIDGTDQQKYSKGLIGKFKGMTDKEYSRIVEECKKIKFFPIVVPPFKSPKREDILVALKYLGLKASYPLFIPEYQTSTSPVTVGYNYVMKLEHISEKKMHSRGTGPYVAKTSSPTAGKSRDGSQLLGEYDLYSLLSWDCPIIVDEMFGPLSSDHRSKNEMISEVIRTGKTDFKNSNINPLKDLYGQYMLAIHLESE